MINFTALIDSLEQKKVLVYPKQTEVRYKPHISYLRDQLSEITGCQVIRFDTNDFAFIHSAPKNIYVVVMAAETEQTSVAERMPIYENITALVERVGKAKKPKKDEVLAKLMKVSADEANTKIAMIKTSESKADQGKPKASDKKAVTAKVEEWEKQVAKALILKPVGVKKLREENQESLLTFDFGDDFLGVGRMIKYGMFGLFGLLSFLILIFVLKHIPRR